MTIITGLGYLRRSAPSMSNDVVNPLVKLAPSSIFNYRSGKTRIISNSRQIARK
jgi:hypothetical protein